MPEDLETPSVEGSSSAADLDVRIVELEASRDHLRAELDAILNRATDRWLSAANFESQALTAMQKTVSWRVTKPLRVVRRFAPGALAVRLGSRRDG